MKSVNLASLIFLKNIKLYSEVKVSHSIVSCMDLSTVAKTEYYSVSDKLLQCQH